MVEYRSYQDILPIIPSSNNTTLNAAYSQDTSLSQELQDTSLSQELQDTSLSHELHYCSYIIAHRQKKMWYIKKTLDETWFVLADHS